MLHPWIVLEWSAVPADPKLLNTGYMCFTGVVFHKQRKQNDNHVGSDQDDAGGTRCPRYSTGRSPQSNPTSSELPIDDPASSCSIDIFPPVISGPNLTPSLPPRDTAVIDYVQASLEAPCAQRLDVVPSEATKDAGDISPVFPSLGSDYKPEPLRGQFRDLKTQLFAQNQLALTKAWARLLPLKNEGDEIRADGTNVRANSPNLQRCAELIITNVHST